MREYVVRNAWRSALSAVCIGCVALPAAAADWQFNPKIEAGFQGSDNFRLFPAGMEDPVYGLFTNAAFQLRYLDPTDDFSLTPAVYDRYLPDSTGDDTTDPSVTMNWLHTGQTYRAGILGHFIRQSIVEADETTAATVGNQLGNPVAGDSGYVNLRQTQEFGEVTPTFTIDLTQRRHLEVSVDYSNVTYSPAVGGFNVGYNSVNSTVGFTQDFTQRSSGTVRAVVSDFDPQGDFATTRSYGGDVEWDYHVSQISQAYIRVGAVRSTFEDLPGLPPAAATTGIVAGGGFNWTFQVTKVFLDATRTVEPNASGYSVNRDQLRLSLTRAYSPTVNLILAARYSQDSATQTGAAFENRIYGLASAGAQWRFGRAWTLNGEYDFTYQRFESVPAVNEHSNGGVLSVIYEPNRVN
jgi:hypothetical protein